VCEELGDVHESFSLRYRSLMSYKHVGTAGDLVRFGCSLKVGVTVTVY
jgi:hypothetical protein